MKDKDIKRLEEAVIHLQFQRELWEVMTNTRWASRIAEQARKQSR